MPGQEQVIMRQILWVVIFCGLTLNLLSAEVADSGNGGFTVKITEDIRAAPDAVYQKLIHVGDWWNSAHTYSGDAHNLSIEEKAGGCFCEKLAGGGSVHHMSMLYVQPGKMLRLGTKLDLTYSVAGYVPAGMNTWAAPVDSVLTEQLTRLKNDVERGDAGKSEAAMHK
jgi:hypothetical protein